MNYLNRPLEVNAVNTDGFFSGYASVFEEIDSYRDIVKRGAFEKTLADTAAKKRAIPILWQHRADQPVGVYTELKEDEHGLHVEGQLNLDVQQGREAHSLLKQGALSGISIGYNSVRYETDVKSGIRRLFELKLYEASLVTFPACDSARVTDVKSILANGDLPSLPEFENFLCEAGFSRTQAKAIAGQGLTKLVRCEAGSEEERSAIQQALSILKS